MACKWVLCHYLTSQQYGRDSQLWRNDPYGVMSSKTSKEIWDTLKEINDDEKIYFLGSSSQRASFHPPTGDVNSYLLSSASWYLRQGGSSPTMSGRSKDPKRVTS